MPAYEWKHIAGFGETSLVGNVYFSRYLEWQGHCREQFLRDHAHGVVGQLERRELALFTRSCSCDYVGDWGFGALDDVLLTMRLARFRGGRMHLEFGYHRAGASEVVARGTQEVHCKAWHGGAWVPEPFPAELCRALLAFADTDELRGALGEAIEFHREREGRAP